jgi:hypothetical protein
MGIDCVMHNAANALSVDFLRHGLVTGCDLA